MGDLGMRAFGAILLAVCTTWLFSQPAFAEKRVALVMGNSAYRNVVRLANPANDSEAMSTVLKKAGFDVVDAPVPKRRHVVADVDDHQAVRQAAWQPSGHRGRSSPVSRR